MSKRPYRFRTFLNISVAIVMISSAFLTIVGVAILRALRVLPPAFFATFWMPTVILVVANIIATLTQYFLAPRVIRPVESLIRATRKVAKGDFSVRIPTDDIDGEIGELVDSFNAMTEELGSIEIFRNDFIRDFSHEFKTPIVSMEGFARQLKNPDLTPEERQHYCDIIIESSRRLLGMSENILLLSKYEHQQIITDKKEYSLDEQLRDCALLLQRSWEKKNIELEMLLDPVQVVQNEEMLHHVWTNLLANAIKFTDDGGKITVAARESETQVTVEVFDTGIGMTQEEMKHIFDKCYQADPSHSSEGNGFGLCIAKRIVDLSDGTICVRSVPGEGSVFTVTLKK